MHAAAADLAAPTLAADSRKRKCRTSAALATRAGRFCAAKRCRLPELHSCPRRSCGAAERLKRRLA